MNAASCSSCESGKSCPSDLLDSRPMRRFEFGSLSFNTPTSELIATRIDQVVPVLDFAERESMAGAYVAVMLSYEAAPAFDRILAVHQPSDFPLAWAASFPAISNVASETGSITSNSWAPLVSRAEYNEAVSRIRELIAAGDTYQVNYSFPLTSSFAGDTYAWYQSL